MNSPCGLYRRLLKGCREAFPSKVALTMSRNIRIAFDQYRIAPEPEAAAQLRLGWKQLETLRSLARLTPEQKELLWGNVRLRDTPQAASRKIGK